VTARLRSLITLAVLGVLLLAGAAWGYTQVTKPLPGKVELPACVDTDYAAGEDVGPGDVTVSILNASGREGLAGRTLQLFEDAGFPAGQISNAPEGTQVARAEIWVTSRDNPAIPLVRSRVGKAPIREMATVPTLGITVVVGDGFEQLKDGLPTVTLEADATLCSPPTQ
jgi:hypothetical protein